MNSWLRFICVFIVASGLVACASHGNKSLEAESLIDKSRWTVRHFEVREEEAARDFRRLLADAKGVVIFPNVVKGSFIIGAEGGSGVMLARGPSGDWGYPAFYTMGAGSFGLQIGGQASEIVLLLMSEEAIQAVIEYQGKFGGDVQATIGTIGAGIEGATTSNIGADIIGFAFGKGAFFGFSLEGAVLGRRNDLNQAYYGVAVGPREIVLEHQYGNPQADSLRQALAALAPLAPVAPDPSTAPVDTAPVTPIGSPAPVSLVPVTPIPAS